MRIQQTDVEFIINNEMGPYCTILLHDRANEKAGHDRLQPCVPVIPFNKTKLREIA